MRTLDSLNYTKKQRRARLSENNQAINQNKPLLENVAHPLPITHYTLHTKHYTLNIINPQQTYCCKHRADAKDDEDEHRDGVVDA